MGRNVKLLFLIFLIIYFSSKLPDINISNDFIEFFKSYFKEGNNITGEIEFNLRFYIFLFQSYLDYIKIPNKDLIEAWDNNIKPFFLKKYSFEQTGIFNVNADIKFLINEIDNIIKKSKYLIMNKNIFEKKDKINKIPSNDNLKNLDLDNNPIKSYEDQDEFENELDIINIDTEEELMNNKRLNNMNDLNDLNIGSKRSESLTDLKGHSSTIASKSTALSIYDELNNKDLDLKSNYSTEIKSRVSKVKEITPNYLDEFETEGITIVHNKKKEIIQITFNLFLKKIIIGNFFDEYLFYTYNFAEQCFFFMKRDIVFKKIINCYKYYTDLKVPFIQRKKLVHFMNVLVIKLYECYTRIGFNDEVLILIKNFYNCLTNELKPIVEKSKKRSSKIQDFFFSGINAIKTGVDNINKNIKENFENKIKNIKDNEEQNEKKTTENTLNVKENLNILLTKRKQMKEEEKSKQIINIEKAEVIKDENKEKNKPKEKMIPEEEVLNECEKIISLFKTEMPKDEVLQEIEQDLYIYNLKIKNQNNKKNNDNHSRNYVRRLTKSNTEKVLSTPFIKEEKHKEIHINKPYFSCLNYEIKDIGEELIYISQKALIPLKRKELYNCAFNKKSKLITSPNVQNSIDKFNKLIFFIIEDILSYDFPKDRAEVIEKWAYIGDYCKKRKDYNDIFAIDSAFKSYIIVGLKLTWDMVKSKTKKIIKSLDEFCSFQANYRNVRESMKLLNKNEYYIPYLGLLLRDLTFIEEKPKYIINGNFINFEKINETQKIMDDFFRFKKIKDKKNINLIEDLNFFENLENQKEDYLEILAGKLEPIFTLYKNPKKAKRLTIMDKKYFKSHFGKGILISSKRQSHI